MALKLRPALLRKWRAQFPWLRVCRSCLKCKHCPDWRSPQPQKTSLVQHNASQSHQQASEQNGAVPGAPSVQDFEECLARRRQGVTFRGAARDVGRAKDLKLTFCLAEAILDRERRVVDKARSVTVAQDAQGQLLSVRYAACVPCVLGACRPQNIGLFPGSGRGGFRLVRGILHLVPDWGGGSDGLRSATIRAVNRFFTTRRKPPMGS